MKLQQFNGGVNSRLAPQLLPLNQGVRYINIDNTNGLLTSIKTDRDTNEPSLQYVDYFASENEFVSTSTPRDRVEFQRKLYTTDRASEQQVYFGGTYKNMSIDPPETAPTIAANIAPEPIKVFSVRNATSPTGNLPTYDLEYAIVHYDSNSNDAWSTPRRLVVKLEDQSDITSLKLESELAQLDDTPSYIVDESSTAPIPFPARTLLVGGLTELDTPNTQAYVLRKYLGVWYQLGILTGNGGFVNDDTYDISGNTVNPTQPSPFNGKYQYLYTYYNENDGIESAPSPLSLEVEAFGASIAIGITGTTSDPQVTHYRLYRVGGNIAQFSLVDTIPVGTSVYVDTIADDDLPGIQLSTDNYAPAPDGLSFLATAYGMLFGAVDSTLRFTPIGVPHAWPPEYSIQFDAPITAIGAAANGLIVCTRFRTYLVVGTTPFTLSQHTLRGDMGCIAFESMQQTVEGTLVWASEDGLCTSSGRAVQSITKHTLGNIKLTPVSSAVHDEVYYCLNANGETLAWDYRFESILKWLTLLVDSLVVGSVDGITENLYGVRDGFLREIFAGDEDRLFEYDSPLMVEGASTRQKTYKKLYIKCEGVIIFKVYIDGKEVLEKDYSGDLNTYTVQVPSAKQRGYSISFRILGHGTVHEIEYVAGDRQND